jgi:hypothetical protein
LEDGTFAVQANNPSDTWKNLLVNYLKGEPTIELRGTAKDAAGSAADGAAGSATDNAASSSAGDPATAVTTLHSNPALLQTSMLETASVRLEEINLVVPDKYVITEGEGALSVLRTILNINYADSATDDTPAAEEEFTSLFNERNLESSDGVILGFWKETRTGALQVGNTATTIVAYVALYLGVVFLIASAALLAIAQLSETSDNISRYRLLARIGTEDRMLRRAIFSQIAIYFGAPLVLALVHSVVGIYALSAMFANLKDTSILSGSLFAAVIIVLVYGGYFLATYVGSKGILNREAIRHLAQD